MLLLHHFGPIRDTVVSTVAVTGFEKIKNAKIAKIPELEKVPWTPHVKSANRPFNYECPKPTHGFCVYGHRSENPQLDRKSKEK